MIKLVAGDYESDSIAARRRRLLWACENLFTKLRGHYQATEAGECVCAVGACMEVYRWEHPGLPSFDEVLPLDPTSEYYGLPHPNEWHGWATELNDLTHKSLYDILTGLFEKYPTEDKQMVWCDTPDEVASLRSILDHYLILVKGAAGGGKGNATLQEMVRDLHKTIKLRAP